MKETEMFQSFYKKSIRILDLRLVFSNGEILYT